MRLRTKFAVALLAITLVLSGATVAGLEFYKQQAVEEVRGNVNETAGLVAEQISASIRERRDYVGYVASRPRASRFNRSGPFLDAFLANSRFYAAQLIDANGTVVAYRGRISEAARERALGSDQSGVPYVRRALEEGAYVSDVRFTAGNDRPVLIFSAPVFAGGEEPVGVLAAAIFVNEDTFFDMVPPLETGSQRVVITAGNRTLHAGQGSFRDAVDARATVGATGWAVRIVRDRTGLNRRLEQLALFQGISLALVLFSMVGFGYWQYAVSLRQTERLLARFETLREGDYEERIDLSGGTEWERIGEGVNRLADDLRRRETALRKRQQRLEVLHRVLRHNVRNRMTIVLNYADLVADMAGDDTLVDAAETIESAGRDLTRLSEKASQMEGVIERAEDTSPEPTDVCGIVRSAVEGVREGYPDVDIDLSTPESAWVLAQSSLELAVENAVENACEHNDSDDPHVWIEVEVVADEATSASGESSAGLDGESAPRGRVSIEVRDDGPGIPEQDRTVIEEGRETDLEHGSGLGLWVMYWIVDSSGGDLTFDERDPRGAVVRMTFARAPPDERGDGTEKPDGGHGRDGASTEAA